MATKLQRVSELAGQTAKNVTRDADGWKSYLAVAPASINTRLMNSS